MSVSGLERALLLDVLELLATYLWDQTVELGPRAAGVHQASDDLDRFLAEVSARHALASAHSLRPLLADVEPRTSQSSALRRDESRGVIRGRLDVPRYLARRSAVVSLPRRYPIVVTDPSPETPENALVVQVLRSLTAQVRLSPFRSPSAEAREVSATLAWLHARRGRWPWAAVRRSDSLDRLRLESTNRIRKRQTGNDRAYGALLPWLDEWRVDPRSLGGEAATSLVAGLLHFPASESFWERVFEVWALEETAAALVRCGCKHVEGPQPLPERRKGPIYRFEAGVELWFQRQVGVGAGRWRDGNGKALTGVPDVVAVRPGTSPLVIDAKYRHGGIAGRAEEVYKMLGYAENFGAALVDGRFFGMLFFPALDEEWSELEGPGGGALGIAAAAPGGTGIVRPRVDGLVGRWLEA